MSANSALIHCDVFFLGAGKPALGNKPAALKEIGLNTRALDWQLHSLNSLPQPKIHFLGGYHVEEIMASYPQLHYTVIPDWQHHTLIHTLLQAPLRAATTWVLYADTVFRPEIIRHVQETPDDMVIVYDSLWQHRYESRDPRDIAHAEVLTLPNGQKVEFTGLIKLSTRATQHLMLANEIHCGHSLLDLIHYLTQAGFSLSTVDAKGEWAEFNSPADIAHFVLGTKAETLSRLAPLVQRSHIGRQVCFTVQDWQQTPHSVLHHITTAFPDTPIVVRSSAKSEDNWGYSNAGGYASVLNINSQNTAEITQAIDHVIASYKNSLVHDQILIQEFISDVICAGVVFTRNLETGAPYYRINFDDQNGSTASVTAGNCNNLRTFLIARNHTDNVDHLDAKLSCLLPAIKELETLLGYDRLDIEFAIDTQNQVHIFQVRPITVDHSEFEIEDGVIDAELNYSVQNFQRLQTCSPFIVGKQTLFGVMPDWNPAEIIGTRPRPLAFSLYRYLITDEVWATQRAEFGYRDIRPQPLLVAFCHQPYVDIRASFNSFIPASLSDQTATKLVNAYLEILKHNPHLHDKIEFEIAFTIWTPTLQSEATARLSPLGVTAQEIAELEQGLKIITRQVFTRLEHDLQPLQQLHSRRIAILASELEPLDKAILLLEDCKRFGTLAFSHAARAGFVAISFLKSLVNAGILSEQDKHHFLSTIKTVASQFEEDAYRVANNTLSKTDYCRNYGHLRPGTYDIRVEAYWENPERYLFPKLKNIQPTMRSTFEFSPQMQQSILQAFADLVPDLSFATFKHYLVTAIQAREAVKFTFTRNLSCALDYIAEYGRSQNFSREDMAFLQIDELQQLKSGVLSFTALKDIIQQRRKAAILTQIIELPQLIVKTQDFYCFERMSSQPNFITSKAVTAPLINWSGSEHDNLQGNIIMIPQADPGYDWLFAHNIAGLVTQYGGANSHMAIRAAEMALPAAIGIGDKLYEELSQANYLHLDCALQQIRGLT